MKRLLLPLLAAFALPTAVNANWFGNKTFSIVCGTSEYKVFVDGQSFLGDWREKDYRHYGQFTLNEKDKKMKVREIIYPIDPKTMSVFLPNLSISEMPMIVNIKFITPIPILLKNAEFSPRPPS